MRYTQVIAALGLLLAMRKLGREVSFTQVIPTLALLLAVRLLEPEAAASEMGIIRVIVHLA